MCELSQKSSQDVSDRPIKDLVHASPPSGAGQSAPNVVFFGLSPGIKTMIRDIFKVRNSELFTKYWKEYGDKAFNVVKAKRPPRKKLTIEDVEELVWGPTSADVASLCKSCLDGSISLEDVDNRFGKFGSKYDRLANEIAMMVPIYVANEGDCDTKIRERITQIKHYRRLNKCIDAANAVLEFRLAMGLEGDFHIVEDLKNQVCFVVSRG